MCRSSIVTKYVGSRVRPRLGLDWAGLIGREGLLAAENKSQLANN